MKYLLTVILCCTAVLAQAQWYVNHRVSAKSQALYNGAIEALQNNDMKAGLQLLRQTIATDEKFVDAWLSLAGTLGQLKQYDSAVYFYQKALALDTQYTREYLLPLSINQAGAGMFENAKQTVEKLLQYPIIHERTRKAASYRLSTYNFALDFATTHQNTISSFNPVNLGDSINSAQSEYYPSFTINDSLLVFTRRGGGIREDFLKSVKKPNGYKQATTITGKLNDEPSKGGLMVSQDGEWLIFAGNFRAGMGDFDLYICYATPQGWSDPFNMGTTINSEYWDSSPSLSPDKNALYFSSSRPGGFGGKDLYVSYRKLDGGWTAAKNMGPLVNTLADELAPFMHADNQTLYFTSGGHAGYGGTDLYLIRKEPGNAWSKPENLGYPINTIEDEGSLAVAADGITAFFASNRTDSRGGLDLYRFELPYNARPSKTLWVQGQVTDSISGKGLPSALELQITNTGLTIQKLITDEEGRFLITLPVGNDYALTVNRKGYFFYNERFYLKQPNQTETVFEKNIRLVPLAVNASFTLNHILFETNQFILNPSSNLELDKLVQWMIDNPTVQIGIYGHTDNVGKAADNLTLSKARARAVMRYLIEHGIMPNRLVTKGLGATEPVASNKTPQGRALNRRTEIKISKT